MGLTGQLVVALWVTGALFSWPTLVRRVYYWEGDKVFAGVAGTILALVWPLVLVLGFFKVVVDKVIEVEGRVVRRD